jgi:hypothetical protein
VNNPSFEKEGRHEIKFVGPELEYHRLIHWVMTHPAGFINEYPDRRINNIYFDTFDYQSYWESHSGVTSREKVRYRWYGKSLSPDSGALEIKCKKNLLGLKKIFPISGFKVDEKRSWREINREMSRDLPHHARHYLTEYPMPVLINRYNRKYFVSKAHSIRITLDTSLAFYDQRFKSIPNLIRKSPATAITVLEIKFSPSSREHASNIVKSIPIILTRCSKYVSGVDAMRDN